MKKIIALMMTFSLVFSINGFSQDKSHQKVQSAKTEQHSSKSSKPGRRPPKAKTRKRIHKSKIKRPVDRKASKGIRL
jgi:hypothetical protein